MTNQSRDFSATGTQSVGEQSSIPNGIITSKRHTDSLAHECCFVNGCAGLHPLGVKALVAAAINIVSEANAYRNYRASHRIGISATALGLLDDALALATRQKAA